MELHLDTLAGQLEAASRAAELAGRLAELDAAARAAVDTHQLLTDAYQQARLSALGVRLRAIRERVGLSARAVATRAAVAEGIVPFSVRCPFRSRTRERQRDRREQRRTGAPRRHPRNDLRRSIGRGRA